MVGETRALMGGYVAGGINWCFLVLDAVTIAVSLFLLWLFFSSFTESFVIYHLETAPLLNTKKLLRRSREKTGNMSN